MKKFSDVQIIYCIPLLSKKSVGGRRWQKFITELLKDTEIEQCIITSKKWTSPDDLIDFNCKKKLIKDYFPKNVLFGKTSSVGFSLKFRIWLLLNKLITKGSPWDRGIYSRFFLKKQLIPLLKSDVRTIVVTSGWPYSWARELAKLKTILDFELAIDFRDAWSQSIRHSMKTTSHSRKKQEQKFEENCVSSSEYIITASQDLTSYLLKTYPHATNIHTIINSFDGKANNPEHTFHTKTKKHWTICHIGTVNPQTTHLWSEFFSAIPDNWSFTFIGNKNLLIKESFEKNSNFKFIERLPEDELHKKMKSFDAFIFFKNDNFPNSFPSKFFDYILLKKPIILLSKEGIVTKEIKENSIGICGYKTTAKELEISFYNVCHNFNDNYPIQKFSIVSRTKDLKEIFNI